MAIQHSTPVRNARLDAIEAQIGTSAILIMYSGAKPANCAAAATGTVLATLNLPSDWMAAASGGTKSKSGTWSDTSADNTGTIGHYRIYASDGVTCGEQGSITVTGGGGDMTVDNTSVVAGQTVTVTTYTQTEGNS
jgi:hypothetical protein